MEFHFYFPFLPKNFSNLRLVSQAGSLSELLRKPCAIFTSLPGAGKRTPGGKIPGKLRIENAAAGKQQLRRGRER